MPEKTEQKASAPEKDKQETSSPEKAAPEAVDNASLKYPLNVAVSGDDPVHRGFGLARCLACERRQTGVVCSGLQVFAQADEPTTLCSDSS